MTGGDCFVIRNQGVDDHLWVVVSEPALDESRVLLVSLTTVAPHKELACVFGRGEHPWVRHDTCAAYEYARLVTLSQLNTLRVGGLLEMHPPFPAPLLKRLRDRVADSTRIKMEFAELLESQGLLTI